MFLIFKYCAFRSRKQVSSGKVYFFSLRGHLKYLIQDERSRLGLIWLTLCKLIAISSSRVLNKPPILHIMF